MTVIAEDVIQCRHCGQTIAVPSTLTDAQAWRRAADWFANHFCDHRLDHPSAAPPPIAVLGDETGPGGTGPVDQRPRNLTRGGRP